MDDALADRLRAAGVDPDAIRDPPAAFRRLHQRFGRRATLLDRYAIEAAVRGVTVDELDVDTRQRLGREVLAVQSPGLDLRPEAERRDESIDVVAYDGAWAARFRAWRERLREALGPVAARIDHVGSTSVPGLAAKPIVDIQVSVADPEDEPGYVPAIETCGLQLRAREPGHRYFRPPPNRTRDVHLHVCASGSAWEREHLLFRDYLRAHPDLAEAYGRLKEELARRHATDRLAYTDAKSNFILDSLERAEHWARRSGWAP